MRSSFFVFSGLQFIFILFFFQISLFLLNEFLFNNHSIVIILIKRVVAVLIDVFKGLYNTILTTLLT